MRGRRKVLLDSSLSEEALLAIASDRQGLTSDLMDELQDHENAWVELSDWAAQWSHNPNGAPPPPPIPEPPVKAEKKRAWPQVRLNRRVAIVGVVCLALVVVAGVIWKLTPNTATALQVAQSDIEDSVAQSGPVRVLRAGSGSWECGSEGFGVKCWGHKDGERSGVTEVAELDGVEIAALSVGREFGAVVTGDGQVWAWGKNDVGQLGVPGVPDKAVMVGELDASPDQMISGVEHTCILTSGDVYCFGSNRVGQIRGVPSDEAIELTQIAGVSDAQEIGTSGYNTWAITNDGQSTVWGNNAFGQSAPADTAETLPPVATAE